MKKNPTFFIFKVLPTTPKFIVCSIKGESKQIGWIFFSLGDLFIGNGMGKSTSEINPNTFGNMVHPKDYIENHISMGGNYL